MASKKKLRKQIKDLEIRLASSQARENSLKVDIHTLIEGKDVARIQQIKIRSNIEYEFDQNVWFGSRVAYHPPVSDNLARHVGNGFITQIQDSALQNVREMSLEESENLKYFLKDFKKQTDGFKNRSGDELAIGDWVDLFPNPGGFPKKIKSFFVDPDPDSEFPGIMALTECGESYNIDYLTPNRKYNELKKEEEKKEGTIPEACQ